MKRDGAITILLITMIIGLIAFSNNAKAGAINGLELCENVIIPALLPMLILTNIIIKSKSARVINNLFGTITKGIFKLPKCTTGAIILGLIAGYPSGCMLTNELYNEGQISSEDAKRIMSFNFSGGMAFIITAIGSIHLKSTRLGLMLFLSNLLSSIILALIHSIRHKSPKQEYANRIYLPFTDAMVESVESTVHSILNMCAYIILFSALIAIIPVPKQITALVEITNGIMNDTATSLPLYAFFLSFGGICIHFQLIGMLRNMEIPYPFFLLNRIAGGVISYGIMKAYLYLFPQSNEVFSNIAEKTTQLTQMNAGLSIVMIIGCVVIIFDIENKKYKLI